MDDGSLSNSLVSKSSFEIAASLLRRDRTDSPSKTSSNLQGKENKNDNNQTTTTLIPIYDGGGGGGLGVETLTFENIQQKQWEMFRRTIELQAPRQLENLLQEKRQIKLTSPQRKITVSVCREDFPSVKAYIDIVFDEYAAQKAWEPFLSAVTKKLQVEFIYCIIERGDKAPIFRILKLKDGGDYLVRQRESSAVLEVLNTSIPPIETSWEVTKDIVTVKQELAFNLKNIHRVNDRILHLVSQPMTTKTQQEISNQIKNIVRADGVVELINHLYLSNTSNTYLMDMKIEKLNLNYNQIPLFHRRKIDIIAIHRQGIEKMNLLATLGQSELIVKECMHYLLNVIIDLMYEVDIVTLGLKLLSDLIPYLLLLREKVFNTVLDCIQYYSPLSPYHRPRKATRLLEKQKQKEQLATGGLNSQSGDMSLLTGFDSNLSSEMAIEQMEIKANFLRLVKNTSEETLKKVNTITRYPVDRYATEDEKAIYRKDTQSMAIFQYAKVIELDENLQVLTPRTKELRKHQKKNNKRNNINVPPSSSPPPIRAISPTARPSVQDLTSSKLIASRPTSARNGTSPIGTPKHSASRTSSPSMNLRKQQSSPVLGGGNRTPSPQVSGRKSFNAGNAGGGLKIIIGDRRARHIASSRSNDNEDEEEEEEDDDDNVRPDEVKEKRVSISTMPKLVEHDADSILSGISSKDHHLPAMTSSQVKPSDLLNKPKKKKYRIKKLLPNNNDVNEEVNSSVRWKGTLGELGRRAAAPEAVDANRILNTTKNRKNILPVINNNPSTTPNGSNGVPALVNPALLAVTGSGSKPSTPVMATTRSRLDSRRSIRFAGDEGPNDVNDNNIATPSSDNGSEMTGDGTPIAEKPPSPSASSLRSRNSGLISLLSRRASKRALLRRQSSRMSQLTDVSATMNDGNEMNEQKEGSELHEREGNIGEVENGGIIDKSLGTSNDSMGSNTEWLPNVSSTILRKQKPKFRLEPLPITEFPKFRIFDYQMKENVVLIQGFATILKLLLQSYSNREYAFKNHILTELAEIVLVCPAIPKILEYFIDMFHVLYAEGIGDPLDITWQEPEDPSMVLSSEGGNNLALAVTVTVIASTGGGSGGGGGGVIENDAGTVTTISSKYFDAMSEMSLPTIDPDTQKSIISISDTKHNPNNRHNKKQTEGEKKAEGNEEKAGEMKGIDAPPADIIIQRIESGASIRSVNAVAPRPAEKSENEKEEKENVYASSAEIAKFTKRQRIKYNEEIMARIGLSEYDYRYRKIPDDAVILALAMCSNHIEVKENLKQEASFWLEHFNDSSVDYLVLKRKGMNLANIS